MLHLKLFTTIITFAAIEIHQSNSLIHSEVPDSSALGRHKFRSTCPKVLVILSSARLLHLKHGESTNTGNYFNEVMIPSMAIKNAGFNIVYANPKGNTPSYDGVSKIFFSTHDIFEQAEKFAHNSTLGGPTSVRILSSISDDELNEFGALFIPGGNAVLEDLWDNADVGRILRHFHGAGKLTATICNAAITLLAAREGNVWPYSGYRMTVFSNAEWKTLQPKLYPLLLQTPPETMLNSNGAIMDQGFPGGVHIIRDRELITGQNPFTSQVLAEELVDSLRTKCRQLGTFTLDTPSLSEHTWQKE